MPKQTFFNLPENKRKTLIEAAEQEFARVPPFEASIANIIKAAGIPRGSFYQYFEDKEDLFSFLLDEKLKERKVYFITLLKKHNGDIVSALMETYHNFLVELPDEEERNFLKNAMLYASNRIENSFSDMFDAEQDKRYFNDIKELIDTSNLNVKDEKDLILIIQIISAVAFHNFVEKSIKKLSDHEAMELFITKMNLIKQGIYKQ
ncbi:TetR/AcrR family transcriptional regulator [Bacillus dakarensis]|uniref:TetR/AcrR family transcriptional regulator n=1 Tax=Robertmurraya dakarensis TaxID=1926278 RepID=UPI00098135A8|nr:TetR/AcrR family transcriptional regulator [Bacillus dakarensis]